MLGKTFLLDSLLRVFVFGQRFLLDSLLRVFLFGKGFLLDALLRVFVLAIHSLVFFFSHTFFRPLQKVVGLNPHGHW